MGDNQPAADAEVGSVPLPAAAGGGPYTSQPEVTRQPRTGAAEVGAGLFGLQLAWSQRRMLCGAGCWGGRRGLDSAPPAASTHRRRQNCWPRHAWPRQQASLKCSRRWTPSGGCMLGAPRGGHGREGKKPWCVGAAASVTKHLPPCPPLPPLQPEAGCSGWQAGHAGRGGGAPAGRAGGAGHGARHSAGRHQCHLHPAAAGCAVCGERASQPGGHAGPAAAAAGQAANRHRRCTAGCCMAG